MSDGIGDDGAFATRHQGMRAGVDNVTAVVSAGKHGVPGRHHNGVEIRAVGERIVAHRCHRVRDMNLFQRTQIGKDRARKVVDIAADG